MHPLDLVVIVSYLLVVMTVGLLVGRRVRGARDFFLAGRSLTFWVIGLSIIGTNIGSNDYIGASGGAYRVGIAQANFEWIGAIPAMILAAFVFIPVYWRAGVYSFPEYLGLRYNQAVRVIAALIATLFMAMLISVMLWAIGITLQGYLGWPIWLGILVTGAVVGIYTTRGGLAAVAFTDALQVVLMFLGGLAILVLGLQAAGGLDALLADLGRDHPNHLSLFLPGDHAEFPWHGVILGLTLVLSPASWCTGQAILQRTFAARTQWDASAAMMFAALAKTAMPLLIVFPGLVALVLHADIAYPDMALPWVVRNLLPPGLSGLVFVVMIAALQSSLDSALNSSSLLITRDLRGVLMRRVRSDTEIDESDLRLGRWLNVALLLFGMGFAPFIGQFGGIYLFVQVLLSMFQGPILALLILGALTHRATAHAGVFALVSGVALAGLLHLAGVNMLYVAFWSFLYSLAAILAVSTFTPAKSPVELERLVFRRG